ncbi:MAG: hypothetical protein IID44_29780 [Planctomycetes bacterium]|nr:hypothetical protein [Planctomycetota bacterium]
MENQATATLSAPANDTTPALPSATQITEKCSESRTLGQAVELIARGPRTLKRTCDRILAQIEAQPKPTPEEIEQRDKQRAEEKLAYKCRQRAMYWKDLINERGKRYDECRLSTYEITNPKQQEVVDKLRSYCESMVGQVREGRGIVLFGPAGTGKDHLMMTLARVDIINDLGVG